MGSLVDFYRGKRVLVTGDTGFKGSWLAEWLLVLGAKVSGIALPPATEHDNWVVSGTGRRVPHTDLDIRDLAAVTSAFKEAQPEIVFHLAAQSIVRTSYEEPVETADTNIMGSIHVLEAIRATPSVRSLVFITSDKCYRNREWTWGYRETDELGGHDPYSASKAAAEIMFASYCLSFLGLRKDFGAASARAGNVIGGGDWAKNRIIPDCIRSLVASEPIIMRNPDSVRPWQHVLDPLSGYLLLARKLWENPAKFGGAWNFGPSADSVRTVAELVDLVIGCWGSGSSEVRRDPKAPHEAGLLTLNIDKARHELGWSPTWNFGTSVERTVDWYLRGQGGEDAALMARNTIEEFMRSQK